MYVLVVKEFVDPPQAVATQKKGTEGEGRKGRRGWGLGRAGGSGGGGGARANVGA